MDLKCKNRRLCDKIKTKSSGLKKSVSNKGKCSNTKLKSKKNCQSTFSMIKFYESIPNYEQVRDLPDFDFTERVSLLKKIHCDLSQPLINKNHCEPFRISSATSSRKKTSAGKKKKRDSPLRRNTISPSLCRSFSKTTLNDFDEMDDVKPKSFERLRSADSNRTPTPLKRLKPLREKLSTTFLENEFTNEKPRRFSPPMRSPIFSEMISPLSFDIESHPCDLYFNNCNSNFEIEYKPPVCFRDIYSPPKQTKRIEQNKNLNPTFTITSPPLEEEYRHRRSKSCPKELFEAKKPCLNFQTDDNVIDSGSMKQQHTDNNTPSLNAGDCNSSVSSRQRNRSKIMSKSKPKTPNSMDEYLSSKMVRSNLAANLRQKWSQKRINEMAEEKLKATMTVAKCIPKCHRWHVKNTNAWKSFTSEDTQTEKRLRELARKEEQRLRQHANAMSMNIMRAKVESAQLLLEGRTLSAKS